MTKTHDFFAPARSAALAFLLAAGCGAPTEAPTRAPTAPVGASVAAIAAAEPHRECTEASTEGLRNCAGAGLKACGQTPAFFRAEYFLVAGSADEIGTLGWSASAGGSPGCMRFARNRTQDLSTIMLSGCLGPADPRPLSLAAMSKGYLLASRAGYGDKAEGPDDIHVQAFVEGGTALGAPVKFPAQSFVWRDESGGGPVLSDARLVSGTGDRALLAYTKGLETWGALLDASGQPMWGPKRIPAQHIDAKTSALADAVPVFGGVAALPTGFLILRYGASAKAHGYSWTHDPIMFVTHIDLSGQSRDQLLPKLPLGARIDLFAEGERGAAVVVSKDRERWLLRIDENGHVAAPVPVAFPNAPTLHAGYAFAGETWLVASDYGSAHAVTTRSKVLLYRVGHDGAILERRELSDLSSDVNERASMMRSGKRVFASWKSGSHTLRRLALAEYEAPTLQAVAAGDR